MVAERMQQDSTLPEPILEVQGLTKHFPAGGSISAGGPYPHDPRAR